MTNKILIATPILSRKGGIERYVAEITEALHRINCPVEIVTGYQEADYSPAVPVHRIPFLKKPLFLMSLSFCMSLAWKKLPKSNLHVQGASSFRSRFNHAHSVHKAWFLYSLRKLKKGSKAYWLKLFNPVHYTTIALETLQYHPAILNHVIAISESVKKDLMHHYKIPEEKITVIYSGVNVKEFDPVSNQKHRSEIRQQWGVGDDEVVLIFVANEFRRKGLEVVLHALARLSDSKIKLAVVGRDDPSGFQSLAKKLEISEQVMFLGQRSDLGKIYAASDIFVFPTQYEPFGLVITEAMASGLPVITSREAGASELIAEGREGLLLSNPYDVDELVEKIKQLAHPSDRQEMGSKARSKVLLYDWNRAAKELVRLYESDL